MVKIIKGHYKKQFCLTNGRGIKQISKMITESIPNQWKMNVEYIARKSDAESIENYQNGVHKGIAKFDTKNDFVVVAVSPPRMSKSIYKSTRFSASYLHKYKSKRE